MKLSSATFIIFTFLSFCSTAADSALRGQVQSDIVESDFVDTESDIDLKQYVENLHDTVLGSDRLYHVQVAGGTRGGFGGEQLLSTTSNGKKVDLYSHDDKSGRQQWKFEYVTGGYYHIKVRGGTSGGFEGEQLLSTTHDGKLIDLYSHDDHSGRQQWIVNCIGSNMYNIRVKGGTSGGFGGQQLLSTVRSGLNLDLYSHDDNSGRQKWRITLVE